MFSNGPQSAKDESGKAGGPWGEKAESQWLQE